jgi:hypothetical protein
VRGRLAAVRDAMKDVVYVGLTVVFFVFSWLYVRVCERV